MRYTTKTEYGLNCLIFLAKGKNDIVNINEISQEENYSRTYIEKILQNLRAGEIIKSHKGKQGGYSLSRDPSDITLKDIIEALEGSTFDVFCDPPTHKDIVCTHHGLCGVRPIWMKTKELLDHFFQSITLEMLVQEENKVSHQLHQDPMIKLEKLAKRFEEISP